MAEKKRNRDLSGEDLPEKTIGRLSFYRRTLQRLLEEGRERIYSHELAEICGNTPAQVRRDLMAVRNEGSTRKGYDVTMLIQGISEMFEFPIGKKIVLIGVGNLGRALMAFFNRRRPGIVISDCFDVDPKKTKKKILGRRIHPMKEFSRIAAEKQFGMAVLTVPASEAQGVADQIVEEGIVGILNFVPVTLRVPPWVVVEDVDMTMMFERTIYRTHQHLLSGPNK